MELKFKKIICVTVDFLKLRVFIHGHSHCGPVSKDDWRSGHAKVMLCSSLPPLSIATPSVHAVERIKERKSRMQNFHLSPPFSSEQQSKRTSVSRLTRASSTVWRCFLGGVVYVRESKHPAPLSSFVTSRVTVTLVSSLVYSLYTKPYPFHTVLQAHYIPSLILSTRHNSQAATQLSHFL